MAKDIIGNTLRVGVNPQFGPTIVMDSLIGAIHESAAANPPNLLLGQFTADIQAPTFINVKGRGSVSAPGDVVSADRIFDFQGYGYSGGTLFNNTNIRGYVDAAVVSGQAPAMRLVFETGLANATALEQAAIFSNGFMVIGPSKVARGVSESLGMLTIGGNSTVEQYLERASADATPPRIAFRKTRGTLAAPADASNGDWMGSLAGEARATTVFETGSIKFKIDATVVGAQRPASRIEFWTNNNNAVAVANAAMFSNGFMGFGFDQVARNLGGQAGLIHIGGNGTTQQVIERASTDITSSKILFRKSRGTLAAQTNVADGDQLGRIEFDGYSNTNFIPIQLVGEVDGAVVAGQMPGGIFRILTAPINGALTNRLRIYAGGLTHLGDAISADLTRILQVVGSTAGTSPVKLENTVGGATAHVCVIKGGDNSTTGSDFISFLRPDNTKIGDVDQNTASTVVYNVSSDERLKENITDSEMGLEKLMLLRPRRFNYKGDVNKQSMIGFIAQEVHDVFPDAVSVGGGETCDCMTHGEKKLMVDEAGEKFATDEWDGKHVGACCHINPWGVDYGRITPLLVKAIQELYDLVKAG